MGSPRRAFGQIFKSFENHVVADLHFESSVVWQWTRTRWPRTSTRCSSDEIASFFEDTADMEKMSELNGTCVGRRTVLFGRPKEAMRFPVKDFVIPRLAGVARKKRELATPWAQLPNSKSRRGSAAPTQCL